MICIWKQSVTYILFEEKFIDLIKTCQTQRVFWFGLQKSNSSLNEGQSWAEEWVERFSVTLEIKMIVGGVFDFLWININ